MTASSNGASPAVLRILIVEDEYLVACDIAHLVEGMGHEVVGPVARIEEAIALIQSEALDGVLLDANLGDTSSAVVAAELTARSMPFVVTTGYGDLKLVTPDLDNAPRVGKPLGASELAVAIGAHFAG